ncbi:COG4-domain-containing protein [Microthyrium microscopicum]|uniref:Conserved oligomeric Golgi complex subunit 4 n=1 Tax=Microthyrium microscopicum TaxID=703497 RepID=A0A6A6TXJ9_9PEZI|nr:COG4-domain-containing protein [Microthyrium microscopicum]
MPSDDGPIPSVEKCSSVEEIQDALVQLSARDRAVTARLDELIATQNTLSRDLGRLDLLRAHLGSQVVATRSISHGMLFGAADTAKRISSAVKRLDTEQENVKATLAMVEQVAELKACVLGVHGSMGAPQDWETAATYLSRASKIPADVIDGAFAEQIVPTAEVPDPPRITLQNAAESLCGLFLREFEKATKEGDGARVTRFFKLFPLIGKAEVGLDAYGRYVCQGVAARARQNLNSSGRRDGFFYGNALTKLFEHIAQIVDAHEPVVQRHYGPGQMTRVIERLQMEADMQGGIILDSWYEDKTVDRKLTDIKSYAFSFLVQSFLAPSHHRSDSPALRRSMEVEEDTVDMKNVDSLLNESGLMLGRWALYSRFLATKSQPLDTDQSNGERQLEMPKYLLTSTLFRKVNSHLLDPYVTMTTFMVRRSLEKAFQLDEMPSGLSLNMTKQIPASTPYITSAVDDVMYVVAQMLQRSLATSQRSVVASVLPTISRFLDGDFIGMIQRKMRDECYPKPVIQGSLPPEEQVLQFLVLINNLDVATDYIKRIVAGHLDPPDSSSAATTTNERLAHLHASFPFADDATFTVTNLRSMQHTFVTKCTDISTEGVTVILRQVIKPRIRHILTEAFRGADYAVTAADSDVSDSDSASTSVPARFTNFYNAVMRPIKRILTPTPFALLLAKTVPEMAALLERRLWTMGGRVSELGAIRLERDLAGVVAAATRDGKYELRNSFERCVQIAEVASMENEEWEELLEAEREGEELGREWALDREERKRARGLVAR